MHTLQKHKTKHAIVVQYTSSLEQDCIDCLRNLQSIYPILHTQHVEPIGLPQGLTPIASRFDDTLTKLRAFEPMDNSQPSPEPKLEAVPSEVCFLDADMMIFRNLDDIFNIKRPSGDWIAAHHACSCNIDGDPWADPEWKPENCPNTPLTHPTALTAPISSLSSDGVRPTYQLLNSGSFVCSPSHSLWKRIQQFLAHDSRVKTFTFPDQNFMDVFFADHWVPMGWQYNALKTHRYWHAAMWRDEEVRSLHYIVDKPWEKRVAEGGTAGYLGRDGETHGWWWREYGGWEGQMEAKGTTEVLETVRKYVCVDSKLGETRF